MYYVCINYTLYIYKYANGTDHMNCIYICDILEVFDLGSFDCFEQTTCIIFWLNNMCLEFKEFSLSFYLVW